MKFAISGVGGYIARKHLDAIKAIGGELVCAFDPNDSVGILDSYNKECAFYRNWNAFAYQCLDRHVNFVALCGPSDTHALQIVELAKQGTGVICEKPVAISEANIGYLLSGMPSDARAYSVLQCRHHRAVEDFSALCESEAAMNRRLDIGIEYYTPRGPWYEQSWKADKNRSGGMLMNIGVHLIDILHYVFGNVQVKECDMFGQSCTGVLEAEHANARIEFLLTIRANAHQPARRIKCNGKQFDLTNGFTDLHAEVYRSILGGKGTTIKEAIPAIRTVLELTKLAEHR